MNKKIWEEKLPVREQCKTRGLWHLHEEVILYTARDMKIADRFRIYADVSVISLLLYRKNLYTLHLDPLCKPSSEATLTFGTAVSETASTV